MGVSLQIKAACCTLILASVIALLAYHLDDYMPREDDSKDVLVITSKVIDNTSAVITKYDGSLNKQISLTDNIGQRFSFAKNLKNFCSDTSCIFSGKLDISDQNQNDRVRNFLEVGLRSEVSRIGLVPTSDTDVQIFSEDDIRFIQHYRKSDPH